MTTSYYMSLNSLRSEPKVDIYGFSTFSTFYLGVLAGCVGWVGSTF